jgi:hypothetical protein
MSVATVQNMIEMIPELVDTDSGTLSLFIADAKAIVEGDGTAETETSFNMLHRYMTAHLLVDSGIVAGNITNESVGDVSVQYSNVSQADIGSDRWEMLYNQHKTRIQGLTGRIL